MLKTFILETSQALHIAHMYCKHFKPASDSSSDQQAISKFWVNNIICHDPSASTIVLHGLGILVQNPYDYKWERKKIMFYILSVKKKGNTGYKMTVLWLRIHWFRRKMTLLIIYCVLLKRITTSMHDIESNFFYDWSRNYSAILHTINTKYVHAKDH